MGTSVSVGAGVFVGTGVCVGIGVWVGTGVSVGTGVDVDVSVGVKVGTGVAVGGDVGVASARKALFLTPESSPDNPEQVQEQPRMLPRANRPINKNNVCFRFTISLLIFQTNPRTKHMLVHYRFTVKSR